MSLTLGLPPLESRPVNPPETRPAAVTRWLDGLLQTDPVHAAREMSDALAALNRFDFPDARRLELADQFWAAALTVRPQLEAKFVGASQPLGGRALEAAKTAIGLAFELGVAYKRLLVRHAAKRLSFGGTRPLVELVCRSLEASARVLATSYLSYSPVPPKTWLDAHAIYAFAHERGLAAQPATEGDPEGTPEHVYVQALLLALANPYGFFEGEVATVIEYTQRACRWAKLTDVAPVHRLAKAVAIVPVGHDFPPFAANKGGAIEGGKMYLLTFDLAFKLQAQLQALEAGGPLPRGVARTPGSRLKYIGMMKRLLRQWAIPPARQFNRVPSRARVLMCAGLHAVWQNTVNANAGVRRVPSGLPPMTRCQVINHTPAGYALRQTDDAPAALRIGELIAIQGEGRTGIQIALVRWFRNTLKGSGLEFGCELLSDRPEASLGRGESAADAQKSPILLLPEDPATSDQAGSAPQVVVPAGAFAAEQAMAIERDAGSDLVVLTKLVEDGPGYEVYDYTTVG